MVILRSSNRNLTKVEVDHDLNALGYETKVLATVLNKYGYESKTIEWKKNQMDALRNHIEKERRDLNDLFLINVDLNRSLFTKKYQLEKSKQLFVNKERYFNLDLKIKKLRNLTKIIANKSNLIVNHINSSLGELQLNE